MMKAEFESMKLGTRVTDGAGIGVVVQHRTMTQIKRDAATEGRPVQVSGGGPVIEWATGLRTMPLYSDAAEYEIVTS